MGTSFLTHHAGILLSHPGVGYLYSPPPPLRLRQLSYPTELLFYDTTTKKVQTIIIFRIIDGTIRFNNAKIQTQLTFYFRFEMPNMYYF